MFNFYMPTQGLPYMIEVNVHLAQSLSMFLSVTGLPIIMELVTWITRRVFRNQTLGILPIPRKVFNTGMTQKDDLRYFLIEGYGINDSGFRPNNDVSYLGEG